MRTAAESVDEAVERLEAGKRSSAEDAAARVQAAVESARVADERVRAANERAREAEQEIACLRAELAKRLPAPYFLKKNKPASLRIRSLRIVIPP